MPVGLAALTRAIELNGVGVASNQLAFSLGRLAAADPQAVAALLREPQAEAAPAAETLEAIVARGVRHLTGYQGRAYARRYADFVARVRTREAALGADAGLPFTRAVARSLLNLMAYKDEYEVARLYTDGEFLQSLHQQFEGEPRLEFYMAPPLLSRAKHGQRPRKIRLGGWMLPAMKLLAHGRRLRGTVFDVFGYTEERGLERALIREYAHRIDSLLPALAPERLQLADRDRARAAVHARLRPGQARQRRRGPVARGGTAAPVRSGRLSAAGASPPPPASCAASG